MPSQRQQKEALENAIDAWTQEHFGEEYLVTEYTIVTRVQSMTDPSERPRYLFGWRRNADMDALYGLVRRLRKFLRKRT